MGDFKLYTHSTFLNMCLQKTFTPAKGWYAFLKVHSSRDLRTTAHFNVHKTAVQLHVNNKYKRESPTYTIGSNGELQSSDPPPVEKKKKDDVIVYYESPWGTREFNKKNIEFIRGNKNLIIIRVRTESKLYDFILQRRKQYLTWSQMQFYFWRKRLKNNKPKGTKILNTPLVKPETFGLPNVEEILRRHEDIQAPPRSTFTISNNSNEVRFSRRD